MTTEEGNVKMKASCYSAVFEDGGRTHKPRNARHITLEAGEGKEELLSGPSGGRESAL